MTTIHEKIGKIALKWWYKFFFVPNPRAFPKSLMEGLYKKYFGIPFAPFHYYSPVSDKNALREKKERWYRPGRWQGVDWNVEGQLAWIRELTRQAITPDSVPDFDTVTRQGYGLGYGEIEAVILYKIIRYLCPKKVVEVGSGVSTYFTLKALEDNLKRGNGGDGLVCVEPFPSAPVKELAREKRIELLVSQVQDTPEELFENLDAGDVLFIDSSHVSKLDSDVNTLYLEVLPRLKKGVWVHIHDIPFPYLSVDFNHPIFDQFVQWNESALVKAFLLFNRSFEIVMCQSYLHYHYPGEIKKLEDLYDPARHFPASLWIRKIV